MSDAAATSPSEESHVRSGILLLVAASALWSLNGVLIKLVYADGAGPSGLSIAFYRSLFAGLLLVPLAWRGFPTLASGRWPIRPASLFCIVFYTGMTANFVIANTRTAAANAIILQYTATFWIFALSPILLAEYPRRRDMWILCIAIAGIAIIFLGNEPTDQLGLANALASGMFFGLLTMMIRKLRTSDSAAVTVANNLGSALLLLPFMLAGDSFALSLREFLLLVLMGGVQFGLPYYLYSKGLSRVPAFQACLITLMEPILVPLWTLAALGEQIPRATLAGGSLIIVALLIFFVMKRKTERVAQRVVPPAGQQTDGMNT